MHLWANLKNKENKNGEFWKNSIQEKIQSSVFLLAKVKWK